MPSFVTAFQAILAELPSNLKARIPASILLPLAVTIASILSIYAYVNDLKALHDLWSEAGAVEKTLLSGLGFAGFYVLAVVLGALQPVVEQGFQQAFGIPVLKAILIKAHRREWDNRETEEYLWRNLFHDLVREKAAAHDLLNMYAGPPPSSGDEGEDSDQGEGDAEKAERDRLLNGPWFHGMHQVSLSCAANDLPRNVAAGSIVQLMDRTRAEYMLVPGGAMVVDLHPMPQDTDNVSRGRLAQLVVAVPPDRVRELLNAHAAGTLGFAGRPTPEATPLWDSSIPYTRRWFPVSESVAETFTAGDVIDISDGTGGTSPVTWLNGVVFAEPADGGWVVAVPIENVKRPPLTNGVSLVRHSTARIPCFSDPQPQWTFWPASVQPLGEIQGTVRSGVFHYDGAEHPDVVIHEREFSGRYAVEDIPPRSPVARKRIGPLPEERDKVEIVTWADAASESPPQIPWHLFKLHGTGKSGDIAFNCQQLTKSRIVIPVGFPRSGFETLMLVDVPSDFGLAIGAHVATLSSITNDNGPTDPEQVFARPLVVSSPSIGKAQLAYGKLAEISRPWRAFHAVNLGNGANQFALDGDSTVTLDGVAVHRTTGLCPDRYPSGTDRDDVALAIARQIQASQINRKLQRLSTVPDEQKAIAKGYLRRFRDDVDDMLRDCQAQVDQSRSSFRLFYPREKAYVQPTTVGNILQSVESYGYHTYGLDAPLVFARLRNLLDDKARAGLNDAHEQFRFTQWCLLAAIVIGTVGPAIAAHGHMRWLMFSLWFLMLIIAPLLLHRAMVSAALAYAEQLRFVLDRYRGFVMGALGIAPELDDKGRTTVVHERRRWEQLGQWWEYSDQDFEGGYTLDLGKGAATDGGSGEAKAES